MADLHTLAAKVTDEKSFLQFAVALQKDREGASEGHVSPTRIEALGWQNNTIEAFIEAAVAWAEDSDFGRRVQLLDASPWKRFAAFLLSGKTYE